MDWKDQLVGISVVTQMRVKSTNNAATNKWETFLANLGINVLLSLQVFM